jgi:alcohol dehydrogenase (cytochrome c)
MAPGAEEAGFIRALEATSGQMRWEFPLGTRRRGPGCCRRQAGWCFGGSNEGNVFALDARTGRPLWDFQTGGAVGANPVSFTVDGRPYVAIAASRVLYVFGL